jgi:predicted TIM-barrel fold metal-dependent hydrolase
MDEYEGLTQVLTLASPPIEKAVDTKEAIELSRMANDEMAELVQKYPDRFIGAVASLPMNDPDSALKEVDRAIQELNFKGIQIFTPINGKPLDQPEFMPLYEKMSQYELPIWIHPNRDREVPDYASEDHSKYWIFSMFGWPYETTAAMTRLVFGGYWENT